METTIQEDIENLELQLEIAKALRQATEGKTTPMQELAEELHTLLCHWDHTEGCSWYYETSGKATNWTGYAHKTYFAKAVALSKMNPTIPVHNLAQLVQTIKTTKGMW